jgi:hypothetical protein
VDDRAYEPHAPDIAVAAVVVIVGKVLTTEDKQHAPKDILLERDLDGSSTTTHSTTSLRRSTTSVGTSRIMATGRPAGTTALRVVAERVG